MKKLKAILTEDEIWRLRTIAKNEYGIHTMMNYTNDGDGIPEFEMEDLFGKGYIPLTNRPLPWGEAFKAIGEFLQQTLPNV